MANVPFEVFKEEFLNFCFSKRARTIDILRALSEYEKFYTTQVTKKLKGGGKEIPLKAIKEGGVQIPITVRDVDITCPDCGGKEFISQEGCILCIACSWSKCS